MPGSGRANDAEVIVPKEPVTTMKIDDKIKEVDILQSKINLSPMLQVPMT
jgi:hypothetical protein